MALRPMRELPEYQMAEGSPDVLGWSVHDRHDQVAGSVVDLFVDTEQDVVRYLGMRLGDGRKVLLAPASLDLDPAMGVVRVVDRTRDELQALPEYRDAALSPEIEERYYILYFAHREPVGAWEPSPLDVSLPGLSILSDRMPRQGRSERPEEVSVEGNERQTERDLNQAGSGKSPLRPAKPGDGVAIFAANEPWDIADVPARADAAEQGREFKGSMSELGPDAEREELWQAEQPGLTAGFDAMRPLKDHPKHEPKGG